MPEQMEDHGQGEALLKVGQRGPHPQGVGSVTPGRMRGQQLGGAGRSNIWSSLRVSASRCLSTERDLASSWGGGGSSPARPAPAPGSLRAPLLQACPWFPLTGALPPQQRQRQARRRAPRRACWSPSSGSSRDSSCEDSEPEEAPAGGPEPLPAPYTVPDMDLWVPARQNPEELWGVGAGGCPRPAEGPNTAPAPTGQLASRRQSTNPGSIRCLCPAIAHRWSSKEPLGKVGAGDGMPLPGGSPGLHPVVAEASPLHITAPTPGPFRKSCPGQRLTRWRPAPSVTPAFLLFLFLFPPTACGILVPWPGVESRLEL